MAKKEAGTSTPEAVGVTIPPIETKLVYIKLIGDSPLITNRWSEKAKEEMRAKQMKKAKSAKEAKDPEKCYQESMYKLGDGKYGFPAVGFKAAAVDACSMVDGMTKVLARSAFHINAELIEIEGTPQMREDMVRVGMGTADIRYRGEFPKWTATVPVTYNSRVLSAEQIINLFDLAGFGVGVGEWRPQRDGQYGRFHVAREGE